MNPSTHQSASIDDGQGQGALERLERAVWDSRALPQRSDVDHLLRANKRLTDALVSIAEYWNRDRNDSAMHDACWHAINTAEEALALGQTS